MATSGDLEFSSSKVVSRWNPSDGLRAQRALQTFQVACRSVHYVLNNFASDCLEQNTNCKTFKSSLGKEKTVSSVTYRLWARWKSEDKMSCCVAFQAFPVVQHCLSVTCRPFCDRHPVHNYFVAESTFPRQVLFTFYCFFNLLKHSFVICLPF